MNRLSTVTRLGVTTLALFGVGSPALASSMSPVTAGLIFAADGDDATLAGGAVSSLVDQSGLGNDANQSTAAARPTLTSGATLGGTDAVDFNGTSQFLDIGATSTFDTGAITAYIVYSPDNNDNGRIIASAYGDINPGAAVQYSGDAWAHLDGSSNRHRALVRTASNGFTAANSATNATVQGTNFYIGGLIYDSANTTSDNLLEILIDEANSRGTATANVSPASVFAGHQLTRIGGGQSFSNSSDQSLNAAFDGQLAEILIYNRALSATEQGQVESYLFNKHLAIPEPGALTLLAAGSGLFLARRRR